MAENIYYRPEAHGLTIIAEANDPNACYSFNDFVVWKDEGGNLFYASDCGCSCPTPFEDYKSKDDLFALVDWDDFMEAIERWGDSVDWRRDDDSDFSDAVRQEMDSVIVTAAMRGLEAS